MHVFDVQEQDKSSDIEQQPPLDDRNVHISKVS